MPRLSDRLKIKREEDILELKSTTVKLGDLTYPAFQLEALIGNDRRQCTLIEEAPGQYKTVGDPKACAILIRNLEDVGVSVEEKLREAE